MRARITFCCLNAKCEAHEQDLEVPNDKYLFTPDGCPACLSKEGALTITVVSVRR